MTATTEAPAYAEIRLTEEATPEALAVHAAIMPLAAELSVLEPHNNAQREAFYQEGGVQRIPLERLPAAVVPGTSVWCRDEGLQQCGSYKIRGAMAAVGDAAARYPDIRRLTTYSAGNHAQGVALAARTYNIPTATIETFSYISAAKEARIKAMGGTVNKVHSNLEQARDAARWHAQDPHTVLIEPFDAPATMAGQSTMLSESVADLFQAHRRGELNIYDDPIVFTVPGGGGGAAAGMAAMLFQLKHQGVLGKNVQLNVVQMEGCDAIACDLQGRTLGELDTSCDGTAVREPGIQTMDILRDPAFVRDIVVVPKGYVGKAMQALEQHTGHPVEPAGALSLAGAMYLEDQTAATHQRTAYVTTLSGANVTPQTQSEFARAAFSLYSDAYAHRHEHGVQEVLARTASALGAALLVASGPTAR